MTKMTTLLDFLLFYFKYISSISKVGGLFVLGPGNMCDYSYRSSYVGDVADMREVLAAATGSDAAGEEVIYEPTLDWNHKLNANARHETSERSGMTGSSEAVFMTTTKKVCLSGECARNDSGGDGGGASVGVGTRCGGVGGAVGFAVAALFISRSQACCSSSASTSHSAVFSVLCPLAVLATLASSTMVSSLLLSTCCHNPCPFLPLTSTPTSSTSTSTSPHTVSVPSPSIASADSSTSTTNASLSSASHASSGETPPVLLVTPAQVDKMTLAAGNVKCDCTFLQV